MKNAMKYFAPLLLILAILVGCNLDGTGLFYDAAHSKKASTHTNINLLWTDGSAAYVQAGQTLLLYEENTADPQVIDAETIVPTDIDPSLTGRFIATRDKNSTTGFIIFMESTSGIVKHELSVDSADYTLTLGSSSTPFTSAAGTPFYAEYGTYVTEDTVDDWKINGTSAVILPSGGEFVSLLEDTSSYIVVTKGSDDKFAVKKDNSTDITGLDTAEKPVAYFGSYIVTQDLTSSELLSTTGSLWQISGSAATKIADLSSLGKTTFIFEANSTYYLVTNSKMWTISTSSVEEISSTEPFKTLETGTKIVSAWSDGTSYVFVTESNGVYFY